MKSLAHFNFTVRDCDVSTNEARLAIAAFAESVVARASRPAAA